jgi:hypothetical protein
MPVRASEGTTKPCIVDAVACNSSSRMALNKLCLCVQEKTAELQKTKISAPITTEIVPEQQWYSAEEYHQKYLVNNPGGYCNHYERW